MQNFSELRNKLLKRWTDRYVDLELRLNASKFSQRVTMLFADPESGLLSYSGPPITQAEADSLILDFYRAIESKFDNLPLENKRLSPELGPILTMDEITSAWKPKQPNPPQNLELRTRPPFPMPKLSIDTLHPLTNQLRECLPQAPAVTSRKQTKRESRESRASRRQKVIDPILNQKNWEIDDWCKDAGVDWHTVSNYHSGKTKKLRKYTAPKLAKSLGIARLPDE